MSAIAEFHRYVWGLTSLIRQIPRHPALERGDGLRQRREL